MKRETVARVDEGRCIGCARCIDACPVDAVVGARGLTHTVVEPWCNGCGLCPPACPVDCIDMVAPRAPWTTALEQAAGERARSRKRRARDRYRSRSPEERRRLLADVLARRK
jgi:Na+-translocating ferredoxin:NAD+ oxidoreductase subunit B